MRPGAAGCGRVRKVRIRSRDLKSDQKSIFIIFIYKWRHLMAKFALNKTTHADSAIYNYFLSAREVILLHSNSASACYENCIEFSLLYENYGIDIEYLNMVSR